MPVLLDERSAKAWLSPQTDVEGARDLIQPAPAGTLTHIAVSTFVNSVRNDGPQCIEPRSLGTRSNRAQSDRAQSDGPKAMRQETLADRVSTGERRVHTAVFVQSRSATVTQRSTWCIGSCRGLRERPLSVDGVRQRRGPVRHRPTRRDKASIALHPVVFSRITPGSLPALGACTRCWRGNTATVRGTPRSARYRHGRPRCDGARSRQNLVRPWVGRCSTLARRRT